MFGPAPKFLDHAERWSVHRVLHLPMNAITTKMATHWRAAGGPRFRSIACLVHATPVRFFARHSDLFLQWWRELVRSFEDCAPLAQTFDGLLCPVGWKSMATVAYVVRAAKGPQWLFRNSALPVPCQLACSQQFVQELFRSRVVVAVLAGVELADQKLQRKTVRELEKQWMADDTPKILARRFVRLVERQPIDAEISKFCKVSRGLEPRAAMATLRTAVDGWPITSRYQQEGFVCIFGCPRLVGSDDLRHYGRCPILRQIVAETTSAPLPFPSRDVFVLPQTKHQALQTATATKLYLVFRRGISVGARLRTLIAERKFGLVREFLSTKARAIAHDLGGVEFARGTQSRTREKRFLAPASAPF